MASVLNDDGSNSNEIEVRPPPVSRPLLSIRPIRPFKIDEGHDLMYILKVQIVSKDVGR